LICIAGKSTKDSKLSILNSSSSSSTSTLQSTQSTTTSHLIPASSTPLVSDLSLPPSSANSSRKEKHLADANGNGGDHKASPPNSTSNKKKRNSEVKDSKEKTKRSREEGDISYPDFIKPNAPFVPLTSVPHSTPQASQAAAAMQAIRVCLIRVSPTVFSRR
jgi:hypothetical protein